jgi:enamine deaminase RidA (YjgF/YER057c/UK114 family)
VPKQYINPPSSYSTDAYSHAVKAGDTIYISGVVGVDAHGNTVGDGTIVTQIDAAYENLEVVLAEAGASMEDLVSTRVYLTDAEHFEIYKATREKHLTHPGPGLTVLIVKALGRADLLFELEAIAVVG